MSKEKKKKKQAHNIKYAAAFLTSGMGYFSIYGVTSASPSGISCWL